MLRTISLSVVPFVLASVLNAQTYEWIRIDGVTSAQLATTGWKMIGSSNFAIEERDVISVTFWQLENGSIARCLDSILSVLPSEQITICQGAVIKDE